MSMNQGNLWESCEGSKYISPISGILYRLVESQEQVATRQLVATLEEQSLLEEILEGKKPSYPTGLEHLHYLLKTPFRYPPLQWGSRFGRIFEPSIFYGGCSVDVTLTESAYYRFVFLQSISNPLDRSIRSQHTLFSVGYKTDKGVRLQDKPFDAHLELISHPFDYSHSQRLGTAMRESGVEVFEYPSARAKDNAACVGLFTGDGFSSTQPATREHWFCDVSKDKVVFKCAEASLVVSYDLSIFLEDGVLPLPA